MTSQATDRKMVFILEGPTIKEIVQFCEAIGDAVNDGYDFETVVDLEESVQVFLVRNPQ